MQPVLKPGARGSDVRRLQAALQRHGFNPGAIDGRFGPATRAAVIGFQMARGLLADGVVGPSSWAALGFANPGAQSVIEHVDVEVVAEMFPHTRIDSIRRNLPAVERGLERFEVTDKPMVLMALATIRAEAEPFEPLVEEPSRYNSSPGGHLFDLYDNRRDLGNRGRPDGARYRGRGFIQLTGRANYERVGELIGLGQRLAEEPDLAVDPVIAGTILAAFLAQRQRSIKEALLEGDLKRARRLVNGGSHGLERFTEAFVIGDRLISDEIWGPRTIMMADAAPPPALG